MVCLLIVTFLLPFWSCFVVAKIFRIENIVRTVLETFMVSQKVLACLKIFAQQPSYHLKKLSKGRNPGNKDIDKIQATRIPVVQILKPTHRIRLIVRLFIQVVVNEIVIALSKYFIAKIHGQRAIQKYKQIIVIYAQ